MPNNDRSVHDVDSNSIVVRQKDICNTKYFEIFFIAVVSSFLEKHC